MGIHPAAAVGVIAVDVMLFGGTVATLGTGWAISIPVGIVLAIAVALIQHGALPRDNLALAAGKGILIGLLTAIPTPLPSAITLASGTMGGITLFRDRKTRSLT